MEAKAEGNFNECANGAELLTQDWAQHKQAGLSVWIPNLLWIFLQFSISCMCYFILFHHKGSSKESLKGPVISLNGKLIKKMGKELCLPVPCLVTSESRVWVSIWEMRLRVEESEKERKRMAAEMGCSYHNYHFLNKSQMRL